MEPLLQSVPLLVYIFFMICGIMKQINAQNNLLHKSYKRKMYHNIYTNN